MAIDLSFNKIVTYALALVVLVGLIVGAGYFFTPLWKMFDNYFNGVMDVLGNAPKPFIGETEDTTTATASINALIYSINKVAWYDTYKDKRKSNFDEIAEMTKDFLGTSVFPIMEKGEVIDDIPSDRDLVLQQITISSIDCWKIFLDKGRENTACFNLILPDFEGEITYRELDNYGEAYDKNDACDDECDKLSDDVFGAFLNADNHRVSMRNKVISGGDNIIICAGKKGEDELFITDSEELAFEECKSISGTNYGMKVKNFQLPQTYDPRFQSGIHLDTNVFEFAQFWAHAYGDPEYILYYETFPKGEDAYWEENAYTTNIVQIFATEAVMYIVFDRWIPGLGKKIKSVLQFSNADQALRVATRELGEEVAEESATGVIKKSGNIIDIITNAFKKLGGGVVDVIGTNFHRIISKISKAWFRHVDDQAAKKAGSIIIDRMELDERASRVAKDVFEEMYDDAASGGIRFLDEAAENLDPQFSNQFEANLIERLNQEGIVGDPAQRIAAQVHDQIDDNIIRITNNNFKRLWNLGVGINDNVLEQFKVWKDLRFSPADAVKIQEGLKEAASSASFFNDLSPAYVRRISSFSDEALEIVLAQQGTREFAEEVLEESVEGTVTKSGQQAVDEILGEAAAGFGKSVDDLTDDQIRQALDPHLDQAFRDILKDNNLIAYSSGRVQAKLRPYATNPRRLISAYVAFGVLREENMREKFTVVGTNAIGFRTPYLATTIYDDFYTEFFDYEEDPGDYEDFFRYYFGYSEEEIDERYLMYRGILPEVNRYYLSLNTEDSYSKRLHLVSPCYGDLVVEKTICECWGDEKEDNRDTINIPIISAFLEHDAIYQTGKSYIREDVPLKVEHFDGEKAMLYSVSNNGQIVKECHPKGIGDHLTFWEEAAYKPTCIQVSVVMDEEISPNYCYRGEMSTKMKIANVGLNWALPIGATIGLGPFGGAVAGAVGGLGYAVLQAHNQWPNHN